MSDPGKYECSKCGGSGVRLWREYQTFLDCMSLYCVGCALQDQSEKGYDPTRRSHDIGWLVPARPTEDGSFWGQTSGPQESVDAWLALPLSLPKPGLYLSPEAAKKVRELLRAMPTNCAACEDDGPCGNCARASTALSLLEPQK